MPAAKLLIIGSGPAGWTAAIYAARAKLDVSLFVGTRQPLGQLATTGKVENFPGFPDGINGLDLVQAMQAQAERFGTRTVEREVERLDLSRRPFRYSDSSGEAGQADAVIIASGASAKYLPLPSVERYRNAGVSACAVCDGPLPRYRDRPLVVVGGGDTAAEEALHLAHFGSVVHLVHRRATLRASPTMADRVLAHPKVNVHWNSEVAEVLGDGDVGGVTGVRLTSGAVIEAAGVFMGIGHQPNTQLVAGQVETDELGYIRLPHPPTTRTSVPGVFAAGDVADRIYRQAVTAAAIGCKAALDAQRWLAEQRSD